MTSLWPSLLARFCSGATLVGALFYLQIVDAPKELVFCLVGYAAVAIAGLLVAWLCTDSVADRLCLITTLLVSGYVVLRVIFSPAPYHARTDLYCVLAALSVYWLAARVFTTGRQRTLLFGAIVIVGLVHVVISVVQAGMGENYSLLIPSLAEVEPSERGSGLYVNPDHLAGLLEVLGIFALSLSCWARLPGWTKVTGAYLTGLCYLGIILTGSRGGYLSAAASLLAFGFLSLIALRSAGRDYLLKFGGGGLLLLAAAIFASFLIIQANPPLNNRFHKFLIDEGRLDLWRAAVDQWKQQPIIGTGSGTYLFYGREFRTSRMQMDPVDVHNDYLHLLAEYGLIGGIAVLVFLAAHVRHGWRTYLRLGPNRIAAGSFLSSDRLALNIGALSALAAYLVHSMVDFNLHIPANALLLALVFGILANPGLDRPATESSWTTSYPPRIAQATLAIILLVQSLRLLPGERYAESARAALRDDEPERAVALSRTALEHETQNPFIHFRLGRALIASANKPEAAPPRTALYEEAIAAFERAHRLAPLDGTYPFEMAHALDRLERFAEAEQMYQIARARDPGSVNLQQSYHAHLERWARARESN